MRFGQDGPALLKPEDNGGLEQGGEEGAEGGETEEVVYDNLPPEMDIKKINKTKPIRN